MDLMKNSRRTRILLGERRCSSFQRFMARSVDFTVLATIFLIGKVIWLPLGWLGTLAYAAIQDSLGQGQSIGKRVMGLQVIEDNSGLPCSISHSILRNAPWILAVFCLPFPVLGVLMQFVFAPVLLLEIYLLLTLESGVRLGDVMGNTLVVEYVEENIESVR